MNHAARMLCSFAIGSLDFVVGAQNLVPNWSFEEYTECPTNLSQLENAVAWQRIGGSPDLYSSCGISDTVNVPSSYQGYQEPHFGDGYAGVITYHCDIREYIQVQLNSPLVSGVRAYVSMYVSPGGFASVGGISPRLMSSGIGLRMSVGPIPIPDDWIQYDFNSALVHMTTLLQDTSGWTHLQAEFIPDSAYEYVQIGNFFEEDSTTAITISSKGGGLYAYAFIDDICVSQTEGACSPVDAIEHGNSAQAAFGAWVDDEGNLLVNWGVGFTTPASMRVLDVTGRVLAEMVVSVPSGRTTHSVPFCASGVYIVTVGVEGHPTSTLRLAKANP